MGNSFFPTYHNNNSGQKCQILLGMKVRFQGYMLVYLSFFPVLGTFHSLVQQPFQPENFSVSGKPFYAVRGDELIISSEATWQCSGSPRRCHVKTALLRQKPNVSLFEDFLNLKPKFFLFLENVVAMVHCSAWRQVRFFERVVWCEVFMDRLQHHKRLHGVVDKMEGWGMNHESIPVATLLSAG